jgi:transcriptional regulator with XRE-family HTH domain
MTRSDVLKILRDQITIAGSQRKFALQHGISPAYLNEVLHGKRPPGPVILKAIDIELEYYYRSTTDIELRTEQTILKLKRAAEFRFKNNIPVGPDFDY